MSRRRLLICLFFLSLLLLQSVVTICSSEDELDNDDGDDDITDVSDAHVEDFSHLHDIHKNNDEADLHAEPRIVDEKNTIKEYFESDNDMIIEENPHYIKNETSRKAIEKALTKKSGGGRLKRLSKHRLKITLLIAAFAFRREIMQLLWQVFTVPTRDPASGKIIRKPVTPSLTAMLKIVLFLDIMRRLHQQQSNGGDGSNPSSSLALLLLTGGRPQPALLLSKLLFSSPIHVPPIQQHYTFECMNDRYVKDGMALQKVTAPSWNAAPLLATGNTSLMSQPRMSDLVVQGLLHKHQQQQQQHQQQQMQSARNETIIIVMDWTKLDTTVSQMQVLRDQVSFLLSENGISSALTKNNNNNSENASVEIIVLLESPGGSAAEYALASEQLLRLRKQGIDVTICVDKVAASGGYMIACTSSPGRLYAAPFAVLGSIGVIGQSVNIHKTLQAWGVQPLVFRGGRDKAPVGLIGEVTKEGIAKVQNMVDNTHRAFKRHVVQARPLLAEKIDDLATGEIWLGYDAYDLGLIDRLITSDEYIGERIASGARVLKLVQIVKPKYPFGRPSTSTSFPTHVDAPNREYLGSILSEFGGISRRFSDLLKHYFEHEIAGIGKMGVPLGSPRAPGMKHSSSTL